MPPRQELPDWLRAQPFTPFDHSLKRGRMSGPDLVPMFHGVRTVVGGPGDWRGLPDDEALRVRCHALLRVAPFGTFFGGITAARLWGLPLPLGRLQEDCLHTVVWYPDQAANRPGVIGRQINDCDAHRIEIDGLPTIDLPTLFCHLGMLLSEPDLVAVGDAMILRPVVPSDGPPRPFTTVEALRERVSLYRVRGKRRAVRALERMRQGAESRPETLLRLLLVEAGFPEPELNVRLYDRFGTELARVDMLFRQFRSSWNTTATSTAPTSASSTATSAGSMIWPRSGGGSSGSVGDRCSATPRTRSIESDARSWPAAGAGEAPPTAPTCLTCRFAAPGNMHVRQVGANGRVSRRRPPRRRSRSRRARTAWPRRSRRPRWR